MMTKDELLHRSSVCELCGSSESLEVYKVEPKNESILMCSTCKKTINSPEQDITHWHCLNESMWSEIKAVQVVAYKVLHKLKDEIWARDLLDMFYLEEDTKEWALEGLDDENDTHLPTKDSNGVVLNGGDSVSIIKDLVVKGAGFTAKRGTVVKNISLTDNPEQIEGKINGVKIVLLSKFLKKI